MQLCWPRQGRSYVLLQQNLGRVIGKLVLICDSEDLTSNGYVWGRMLNVNWWEVNISKWLWPESAICHKPKPHGEGFQRWSIYTGAIDSSCFCYGDSIGGWIEKLEIIKHERCVVDAGLCDFGHGDVNPDIYYHLGGSMIQGPGTELTDITQ